MRLEDNSVLVTGGGSGIGLALARRFLAAGSTVAICGRRRDVLDKASATYPGILTHVCDLGDEAGRRDLVAWIEGSLPDLNVLVNSAGVQRYPRIAEQPPWQGIEEEIAINLAAPVDLVRRLLPRLARQLRGTILNVTSGLAFVPMARAPIYCATKAALRSFTLSLRHQLRDTSVAVVEVIPPAVDTDLGGPGLHTFGVAVDTFADHVMAELAHGADEIAYGFADEARGASPEAQREIFARINARR